MRTWHPGLAIGHHAIDTQHQELFGLADRLIGALRRGQAQREVLLAVEFLGDYCRRHFRMEEALMRSVGYPFEALHRASHQEFERRFRSSERKAAAKGGSAVAGLELSSLIRGWFVDHIGIEDVKIAQYTQAPRGAARPHPPAPPSRQPMGSPAATRFDPRDAQATLEQLDRLEAGVEVPLRARSAEMRRAEDTAKLAKAAGLSQPDMERVLVVLKYYDML